MFNKIRLDRKTEIRNHNLSFTNYAVKFVYAKNAAITTSNDSIARFIVFHVYRLHSRLIIIPQKEEILEYKTLFL